MRVVVDTLVPTPTGLVCGSVVHYQEGGPIRFVQIEIPLSLFTWEVMDAIYKRVGEALDQEPSDEPLF